MNSSSLFFQIVKGKCVTSKLKKYQMVVGLKDQNLSIWFKFIQAKLQNCFDWEIWFDFWPSTSTLAQYVESLFTLKTESKQVPCSGTSYVILEYTTSLAHSEEYGFKSVVPSLALSCTKLTMRLELILWWITEGWCK